MVFHPQLPMHYSYLPFVLHTLPIFGTPQPYRYHVKLISQWTSCQAEWKFYTALLRSQDRFEFTRKASDSSASLGSLGKQSVYLRTRKCLSLFKSSVMVLLNECIIWAYWAEL
jgi:hypothetical protein